MWNTWIENCVKSYSILHTFSFRYFDIILFLPINKCSFILLPKNLGYIIYFCESIRNATSYPLPASYWAALTVYGACRKYKYTSRNSEEMRLSIQSYRRRCVTWSSARRQNNPSKKSMLIFVGWKNLNNYFPYSLVCLIFSSLWMTYLLRRHCRWKIARRMYCRFY